MNLLEPFVFFASVVLCFIAAAIGSHYTEKSVDTWYLTLNKPVYTPPQWVFPVVWSVLYFLMGISLATILTQGTKEQIGIPVSLFALQLLLNMAWSYIFFGQKNPMGGFVTAILLWFTVAFTTLAFAGIAFEAGLMLVPYLIWVSFALLLNYGIVRANQRIKTISELPIIGANNQTPIAH